MTLFLIFALLFTTPAHAEKSECQIQKRRILDGLERAYSCSSSTDCRIASLSCGFGCNVGLNGKQSEIADIMGMFEQNCRESCDASGCASPDENLLVECRNGICATYLKPEDPIAGVTSTPIVPYEPIDLGKQKAEELKKEEAEAKKEDKEKAKKKGPIIIY